MIAVAITDAADELATSLVAVHEGDALAAHNDARELAQAFTRGGNEAAALTHHLAAETIIGRWPQHFMV